MLVLCQSTGRASLYHACLDRGPILKGFWVTHSVMRSSLPCKLLTLHQRTQIFLTVLFLYSARLIDPLDFWRNGLSGTRLEYLRGCAQRDVTVSCSEWGIHGETVRSEMQTLRLIPELIELIEKRRFEALRKVAPGLLFLRKIQLKIKKSCLASDSCQLGHYPPPWPPHTYSYSGFAVMNGFLFE